MRLHRITATNNQKAIAKINEMLGPNALIYSTRVVPEGVEMVVGMPHSKGKGEKEKEAPATRRSSKSANSESNVLAFDKNEMEKLHEKIHSMDENMRKISSHLDKLHQDGFYANDDDQSIKRNQIFYYLSKHGFRGQFCHEFIKEYLFSHEMNEELQLEDVQTSLLKYIDTCVFEPIDDVKIMALIGPTGVGKTTTITKLANRYISKYGHESIGLITLDEQDINIRNQLMHYSNKLKVDLEFANTIEELSYAIQSMQNKELILIDTFGVSQRDQENVEKLKLFLESQGDSINTYVTLPCNVQERILDEITYAFRTTNLQGCILTKQDESFNITPAVNVAMSHKLPIAYLCNGQNVYKDIESCTAESILKQILIDGMSKSKFTNENISHLLIEGTYDRQ